MKLIIKTPQHYLTFGDLNMNDLFIVYSNTTKANKVYRKNCSSGAASLEDYAIFAAIQPVQRVKVLTIEVEIV